MTVFVLAIGGSLGGIARYRIGQLVQHRTNSNFPLGTALINMVGAWLLGILAGTLAHHPQLPASLNLLFGTGFCGAFTTFSSFAWDTLRLWQIGQRRAACMNLLGQPMLGLLFAWIGLQLAR